MEYGVKNLDWNASAGQRLDLLAQKLPPQPRLEITVFGSAPLQLFLDRNFLSADIDIFPTEETYSFLLDFVTEHGMDKADGELYIQVCDPHVFRSSADWRDRAIEVERHGLDNQFHDEC